MVGYSFTKELAPGRRNFLLELPVHKQYEILESCFIRMAERTNLTRADRFEVGIGYGELVQDIKYLTKDFHNEELGDNKVKNFTTEMKHNGFLVQEKERKPYFLKPNTLDD